MSIDNLDEFDDEFDDGGPGGGPGWCVDLVIGIELPDGQPAANNYFDVELRFDHPPTRDEIAAQVLDETAGWYQFYISSAGFVKRAGDNPPLTIVGETHYRC